MSQQIRPHPRYGWIPAVIPADARRFRVAEVELAATLAAAGAELVQRGADVEVGPVPELRGDAQVAIVEIRAPLGERERARLRRGTQRLVASAALRARAVATAASLRRLGYASTLTLPWERGVSLGRLDRSGTQPALAHRFPVNGVVVGRRVAVAQTAFDAALADAERAAGVPLSPHSRVLGASGVIVCPTPQHVLRVALGPAASRIDEQAQALEALGAAAPDDGIARLVPWVSARGRTNLTLWSVERRLAGTTPRPPLSPSLLEQCREFLVALHACGDGRTGPGAATCAEDASTVAAALDPPAAEAVLELGTRLDEELRALPRGFAHGDFWSGNLLVAGGRLVGVVDWPSAASGRLPLLDLIHLDVNEVRERWRCELGTAVVRHLLPQLRGGGTAPMRAYCRSLGFDVGASELEALGGAYWLQAIAHELVDPDRDPHACARPRWREQNVDRVLAALDRSASRRLRARREGAVLVADPSELAEATDEWSALAERRGNPFVSPEWFFAWIGTVGVRQRPFVPVLRDRGGRLVGVLPLVLSARGGLRSLAFAGAELGDYFHPAAAAGRDEAAVAAAAVRLLHERRRDWAVLVADYVDERSHWLRALASSSALRLAAVPYHDHESAYLTVSLAGRSWDGYLATRSRNLRSQLGRKERALARAHDVVYRASSEETLRADMETLFDLHASRWGGRGTHVFSGAAERAFHLEFATAAARRGWLRLWLLEIDGTAIAAWYGWRLGDRYLYYQAGFDPAWGKYSPGLLLLARTLRAAAEEGAAAYDMLLGGEAYKARFAEVERTARTIVFTPASHPARAVVATDVALRRVVRRLPREATDPLRSALRPALRRWPVKTAP